MDAESQGAEWNGFRMQGRLGGVDGEGIEVKGWHAGDGRWPGRLGFLVLNHKNRGRV